MAKKAKNSHHGSALTTDQINMLVVAYIAQRLSFVRHPEAWGNGSRKAVQIFLASTGIDRKGDPVPIPPPPPVHPLKELLYDLGKNLEEPERGDLQSSSLRETERTGRKSKTPAILKRREANAEMMAPTATRERSVLTRL